jgi:predicted MPP superfamily phosphohydrolase
MRARLLPKSFVPLVVALVSVSALAAPSVTLPNAKDSLKFAIIGDSGTGSPSQYRVAKQLIDVRTVFPYEFVLMMGDNLYGGSKESDFKKKFEEPYKALLDAHVPFYASLGNHDNPNERFYKLFNMNGERYYTFKPKGGGVRFFALDSNYMDKPQLEWLEKELAASGSDWKIAFFHHPLYSSGGAHGSDVQLRERLEPLFLKYGVDVVFSGHEHFYERIKPQKGIYYFVSGGAAKLRENDVRPNSPLTAKGFDTGYHFMLIEIEKDVMHFQVISDQGATVDSGDIPRYNDAEKKKLAGL